MANIFKNLGSKLIESIAKREAIKLARQAVTAIEALPLELTIDNATDVVNWLIKTKTGFAVPEVADNFIDAFIIKIANNARLHLVELINSKLG